MERDARKSGARSSLRTLDFEFNMRQFADYIDLLNTWVVFPGMLLAALILHLRRRKRSTLLLSVGLFLLVLGQVGDSLGPASVLHPLRIAAITTYAIGGLIAAIGFGWFLRADLHADKNEI